MSRRASITEAGETCDQLRGVTLECDARLVEDPAEVARIGAAVALRYSGHQVPEPAVFVTAQAAKRVGVRFAPTSVVSWDHRKLGGTCWGWSCPTSTTPWWT